MLQDGPGREAYSQHCQVFGVLTGVLSAEEGRACLLETLEHPKQYAQCSVAMMLYLFRTLEQCGLYERTEALWDVWHEMLANHMTTCAEDPLKSRSDCHGWGALALYEFPAVILGVRPAAPGFEKILVQPLSGHLRWAKGQVIKPRGMVSVSWEKKSGGVSLSVLAPEGVEVIKD